MSYEITNILVGITLFIVGVFIGNGFNYPIEHILSVNEIITFIGVVATICIGLKALHTWKYQFKHNEQYKAALQLEGAFRKYLNTFVKYRYAFLKMAQEGIAHGEIYKSEECKYSNSSHYLYIEAWSYMTAYLDDSVETDFEFTPKQLEIQLINLLTPVYRVYDNKYNDSEDMFHEKFESIWVQGIQDIRKIREYS